MHIIKSLASFALTVFTPCLASAFGADSRCTPGNVPWLWAPTAQRPHHFALPRDATMPAGELLLGNNTYYYAAIRASSKVETVAFHYTHFAMNPQDVLRFPFLMNPAIFSGNMGAFTTPAFVSESGVPWNANIIIQTNDSDSSFGFSQDYITVACRSDSPAPGDVEAWVMKKNLGILTESEDTVYYSYPPPPSPYHLHVALNVQSVAPGTDFDLYARCGAYPTATAYDYRGYSSFTQEFLDITASWSSRWYFAVNSYNGKGAFELTVGEGGDEKVCFAFDGTGSFSDGGSAAFTTAEKDLFRDNIVKGMQAFYGATGGGVLPLVIAFIDGTTSSICIPAPDGQQQNVNGVIKKNCSVSSVPYSGTADLKPIEFCTPQLNSVYFATVVVPHEYAHHYFRLPDEYETSDAGPSVDGCGHSLMSIGASVYQMNSFCTAANHRRDFSPGYPYVERGGAGCMGACPSVAPYGDTVSMWEKIANNSFNRPINFMPGHSPRMRPVNTPENYTYADFDFNNSTTTITVSTQYN